MQFKTLFFTLFLGIFGAFSANANAPVSSPETAPDGNMLLLPPPAYLNVTNVGTTWVSLAWPLVPGAFSYQVITKEVASGITVSSMNFIGSQSQGMVLNLTPGVEYNSEIFSVDSYGQRSGTGTTSPNYKTIIFELITNGFQAPQGSNGCIVGFPSNGNNGSPCTYTWDPNTYTYFKVTNDMNNVSRAFALNAGLGFNDETTGVRKETSPGSKFEFLLNQDGSLLFILYNQQTVATLSASHPQASIGWLFRVGSGVNLSGYTIQQIIPGGGGGLLEGGDRTRTDENNFNTLTASPNPFSDQLDVNVPFATENQDVMISLYDLQGRMAINQTFTGGEKTLTLPTKDIIPGLYFLHVRAGDKSESIRVLKTQ